MVFILNIVRQASVTCTREGDTWVNSDASQPPWNNLSSCGGDWVAGGRLRPPQPPPSLAGHDNELGTVSGSVPCSVQV